MTISVIIPTRNEASTIGCTLAHLLALPDDGAKIEILVVDGGSHDHTRSIAEKYARVLTCPPSRASQMNAGARESTGEVLVFLHADTLLPQTAYRDIRDALSNPSVVGGRFDARMDHDSGLLWIVCRMVSLRSRLTKIATGDQAIFVRRQSFFALGGYKEIPLMEDVDFSRRLKRSGSIAALRSCVVTSSRRWQQNGIIHTILLMWLFRFLFYIGVHPMTLKKFYRDIR